MWKMSRVNVTIQFSWVITFPQSDKGAVWWVGIGTDHDRSFPLDSVALHQRAKSSVAEGTFFSVQLSIASTPNASAWPQGFAFNYQLIADILNQTFFFGASYCAALCKRCSSINIHGKTSKSDFNLGVTCCQMQTVPQEVIRAPTYFTLKTEHNILNLRLPNQDMLFFPQNKKCLLVGLYPSTTYNR